MTELSLRGLDEDEAALVLVDSAGAQYRLAVDDALTTALRGAQRRRAASVREDEPLRPRDIQAMIRQGMSAEEIAAETSTDVAHIRLYEGPVLAERQHIAHQAGRVLIRPETGTTGPTPLAELAQSRLRLREVDPTTIAWDAWRRSDGAWQVELTFEAASRQRAAAWSFSRGAVHALDDEARWLSDAGPTDSGPIPGYGSGEERKQKAAEAPSAPDSRDHQTETGRILESLRRRRGVTQSQHTSEIPLPGRANGTGPAGPSGPGTAGPLGSGPAGYGSAADAGSGGTQPAGRGSGGLRLVADGPDPVVDGAHSAPSAPHEAEDASIVAVPAPEGDRPPAERHPDQHTEPIGTPDFDDPQYSGTLAPAPVVDETWDRHEPDSPAEPDSTGESDPVDGAAQRETPQDEQAGPNGAPPTRRERRRRDRDPDAEGAPGRTGAEGQGSAFFRSEDAHTTHSTESSDSSPESSSPETDGAEGSEDDEKQSEPTGRRRGRSSVPSWDEIMFGGRRKD